MRRVSFLAGLLIVAALCAAALVVEPGSAGPLARGPLVQVSSSSPFAGCTADNISGQPGTNFLNSEVEPWVDVDPLDPNHIVAIWQQDRWSNGSARGLVAGVSFDGGTNWQRVVIPKLSLCSGGSFQRASDPWLSFAPNGDLYAISLSTDIDDARNAILASKSTDGGLTWGDPVTIDEENFVSGIPPTPPPPPPAHLLQNDKESLTADPTDASFAYAVWDRVAIGAGFLLSPEHRPLGFKAPAMFSRTTDGGASWEPARIIYDPGANNSTIGNQVLVLPDGTLVDLFTEFLNYRNDNGGEQFDASLSLVRSTNQGFSWRHAAIRAASMLFRGAFDPDTGNAIRAEGLIADYAVDPASGALYAVWQDDRFSGVDEVAFSQSRDGGLSWSTPIRINQTPRSSNPGNQQAFVPSVVVAADGTVAVTYYDFRYNTSAPGALTDYWAIHCHPSSANACTNAANWGDENRLTDASFDMEKAPFARGATGFFVGDYEGLAARGDGFLIVFAATNSDPNNQTDIFAVSAMP